jgi:hypothetical protein
MEAGADAKLHNEVDIPNDIAVKTPHNWCPERVRKLFAHHRPLKLRKLSSLKLSHRKLDIPPDMTMWMIDKLAGPASPTTTPQVPEAVPSSCTCDAGDPQYTANPVSFDPSAWSKHLDEDKTYYFFNRYTGQSRWEGPAERCAYCKSSALAKH